MKKLTEGALIEQKKVTSSEENYVTAIMEDIDDSGFPIVKLEVSIWKHIAQEGERSTEKAICSHEISINFNRTGWKKDMDYEYEVSKLINRKYQKYYLENGTIPSEEKMSKAIEKAMSNYLFLSLGA